jgi:transposase
MMRLATAKTAGQPHLQKKGAQAMDKKSMDYDIYCGIDVGKASVHVTALEKASGESLYDDEVVYEEKAMKEVFCSLRLKGKTLVIVDQCRGFGAMVVALARAHKLDVAHIPPRRFHDVAVCFGEDKTDSIDARIICETAMCMPRFIEPVACLSEVVAQTKALLSYREDIASERVGALNRIHAYLQQLSPPLAALFGRGGWTLGDALPLQVIAHFGGPAGLLACGYARARRWASCIKHYPDAAPALINAMFDAIKDQSVTMTEDGVLEAIVRKTAEKVQCVTAEKVALDGLIERTLRCAGLLDAITSLKGIGAHYGAVIICEIGDIGRFASEGHLASYAGVAPVKRDSGLKKGKRKRKGANRRLKNCFIRSAQSAVISGDAASVAYYEKKRAEGKGNSAAYLALARRRVPMIYEVLKHDASHILANSAS